MGCASSAINELQDPKKQEQLKQMGQELQKKREASAAAKPTHGVTPGSIIAIHSTHSNRFVRLHGESNEVDAGDACAADKLADEWEWERFLVVDAGNGQIALHNNALNRFLRGNDKGTLDGSEKCDAKSLPADWKWERWTVVDAGNGQVAFHNTELKKFLRFNDKSKGDLSEEVKGTELPADWQWERFKVVSTHEAKKGAPAPAPAPPAPQKPSHGVVPGATIAIHSEHGDCFVRLNGDSNQVDGSAQCAANNLPGDWQWERFTVVDAGNGEIGLHNRVLNRFLRATDKETLDGSEPCDAHSLPPQWQWERWTVVDAGNGKVAFHNAEHNRFLRLNGNRQGDLSAPCKANELPGDWQWERFTVVHA